MSEVNKHDMRARVISGEFNEQLTHKCFIMELVNAYTGKDIIKYDGVELPLIWRINQAERLYREFTNKASPSPVDQQGLYELIYKYEELLVA